MKHLFLFSEVLSIKTKAQQHCYHAKRERCCYAPSILATECQLVMWMQAFSTMKMPVHDKQVFSQMKGYFFPIKQWEGKRKREGFVWGVGNFKIKYSLYLQQGYQKTSVWGEQRMLSLLSRQQQSLDGNNDILLIYLLRCTENAEH